MTISGTRSACTEGYKRSVKFETGSTIKVCFQTEYYLENSVNSENNVTSITGFDKLNLHRFYTGNTGLQSRYVLF